MATKANYKIDEIGSSRIGFSKTRSVIETAFYGNNVVKINTVKEAYELAKNSPGTIITDMKVKNPEAMGLDKDTKVLLFNDGAVTGRYAQARRIKGEPGVDSDNLDKIVMDAVYDTRWKKMYHAECVIGLEEEFMVRAHLLIPEGDENLLYNWMLNFQYFSEKYKEMYKNSRKIESEPDIYIFSNPQWIPSEKPDLDLSCLSDPLTLAYFDTDNNCAAILGMKYFGEHKKGTLTMAWALANRIGYVPCHGGQKEYKLLDDKKFVASFFGLSGSGKSTLTHARHNNKYDITILHDDAFIINEEECTSIALEPTYFDKTADYPTGCKDNEYLLTVQNCGATIDEDGKIQIVTEDIRNGNGRAIKSKLWSPNRVDKINSHLNAIFWIMKDPTMPPVLKITEPILAATMGATLATKTSSAERVAKNTDINKLRIVPYANPFRTYPLSKDYLKFKKLFSQKNVECYVVNTGYFMEQKVKPVDTLSIIESIVDGTAVFEKWGEFKTVQILKSWNNQSDKFIADLHDKDYKKALINSFRNRLDAVVGFGLNKGGYDSLPAECTDKINEVIRTIENMYNGKIEINKL